MFRMIHLSCECLPKKNKDIVYLIKVEIELLSSDVVAECTCTVGLGPHGICKHITAGCYALGRFLLICKRTRWSLYLMSANLEPA